MKHIETKNLLMILIAFVVLFAALKGHDIKDLRDRTNRSKLSYATVQDLLFMYEKTSNCDISIDSFYGGNNTIFSNIIINKERTTKSFDGNETYDTYCTACHMMHVIDFSKPTDTLVANAVNGVEGMPPKGLCYNCTDDDIKATILWMKKQKNK